MPITILLYNILPIRKSLDYTIILNKINEKQFLFIIFFLAISFTNLISYFLYNHIPQGDDVVVYFQAKIFAMGKRCVGAPPYPKFFLCEMIAYNDKWFSMRPPGHSILLAIGILLKLPWLICPLLGSFSLLIFYSLIKHLFNSKMAKEGATFLLLSPTFLFVSASMLLQNSSYFFLLLSLFFIVKCKRQEKEIYSLLAGLSSGFAFITRPQSSIVYIIIFLTFLWLTEKEIIFKNKSLIYFLIGIIPFIFLQLVDNYILTGNMFLFPYNLYEHPLYNVLGFGKNIGWATFNIQGHTPIKAIINFLYNAFVLSLHLFGWPLISLLFLPIAIFKKVKNKWEWLFIAIIICSIIFWSFYWFHGIEPSGAKFYYEITPLLVILTIIGVNEIKINIRPLITLLFLIDIFVYIPNATKIPNIWGTNLNCYNEVKRRNIHNAIVFVRDLEGNSEEVKTINRFNYLSVGFLNSPNIGESDIIYANDLGKENKKLIALYPGRKTYLFEYLSTKKYHLIEYK